MNTSLHSLLALLIVSACAATAQAQNTFTLNPLITFGTRSDGSIQPGDSMGVNPQTGNEVKVSAPGGYGIQLGDPTGSTNGFNMRGLAWDPVSTNLVFVDTHSGSGGSGTFVTNAAIYILNPASGLIIGALSTNGISGGAYTHVAAGVADDGVVYVANQVNKNTSAYKIYRWPTANPSDPNFSATPTVAYSNTAPTFERIGLTMAIRGAGTNTQILVGTADPAKTGTANAFSGTNVFLFTTGDGTNFVHHRLYAPGLNSGFCNDGIAFGPKNTFWTKEVGSPLYYLAYDAAAITNDVASTNACAVIASYAATSPNDPMLNLSAIAVDNTNHLLAGLEEIGGTATGGRGKVWLYDIWDPTNRAPAILTSRTYIPNFQKATAPMGYLAFAPGRLYANVVNNGLLASTVDSVPCTLPAFQLPPDLPGNPPRVTDLPATTRTAIGFSVHFEVFATPDVTNYQWYSNNVAIPGANKSYLDLSDPQASWSGSTYKVIAYNAAGSTPSTSSTLSVLNPANFFRPQLLWSANAGSTNYITSTGGAGTPNERCIAYNSLSNQLLVVKGPAAFGNLRIFVVDAQTGAYLYTLNTNGIAPSQTLSLAGIGVADDGVVYACSAAANNNTFAVYRWADTDPATVPQAIFGVNSYAANSNPIYDLVGDVIYRFGDVLAVRGSGQNTEIVVDAQNRPEYVGVLRPVGDGDMTHWMQTGYLMQNIVGSYGFGAYGTAIGRSIQFGPDLADPWRGGAIEPTFWQKRYNASGAPLAGMNYIPSATGVAPLNQANFSLPLFTNGPVAINFNLGLAAAINFVTPLANDLSTPDSLTFYDLSELSQAVLLTQQGLPMAAGTTRKANNNAIAQVIFGLNKDGTTNYLFAIDANNGIAAYYLSGGVIPAPKFLAQPQSMRALLNASVALGVQVDDQLATVAWFKGTNAPVDTGVRGILYPFPGIQPNDAGDYFVIASNNSGSTTSLVAHVTVSPPDDNYTLSPAWKAPAGNAAFPYITVAGANTPNERSFAYNALSNQLIVVRCPPSSTAYTLHVVDATTGVKLYDLDTTGVIPEGFSEVSGANPIDLVAAAAADDGSLYICNMTPNASGGQFADATKMLHVYRWANTASSTSPVLVYQGDPSGQPPGINERWGDAMCVRGSGTNTELFLNSHSGSYGAVLKPIDSSLTQFTNYWFADSAGGGTIGRSVQFGPTNTVFEKRKGSAFVYSSYNTNAQNSAILGLTVPPNSLGGVYVDSSRNLAAGVDFVGVTGATPDAVALYDITQLTTPMLLARYSFPTNHIANNNFICQTIISGSKVYSLNANNGLMAFYINPPVNSMILKIAPVDATHVSLSWGNAAAVLQGTTNLPPAWTDLTAPGLTNSIQPMQDGGIKFYRLIQRR
jgi:hypothetical protein